MATRTCSDALEARSGWTSSLRAGIPDLWPSTPGNPRFKDSGSKTIAFMAFGTRVLKCWVLGPSGNLWEIGVPVCCSVYGPHVT